jgi:hypothetical protein
MTLYARSDLAYVVVPTTSGGCGEPHRPPTVNGAPVKPWKLDCTSQCEDYLRVHMSDQWSSTLTEIAETYDETKAREQSEKSGKLDRERQLADTMIELGKLGQLPEALGQVLARVLGTPVAALAGAVVCPQGHDNPAGKKFCADCGGPLSQPVTKAALPGPERPAEPSAAEASPEDRQRSVRLRDARLDELQALARMNGLDEDGKRPDLISRLAAAGVTSADLQRLPVAA